LREGKRGLRSIFPTVLMERRLDDIAPHNERIREIVLEREAREAGVTASNVGGWHSSADLMD